VTEKVNRTKREPHGSIGVAAEDERHVGRRPELVVEQSSKPRGEVP